MGCPCNECEYVAPRARNMFKLNTKEWDIHSTVKKPELSLINILWRYRSSVFNQSIYSVDIEAVFNQSIYFGDIGAMLNQSIYSWDIRTVFNQSIYSWDIGDVFNQSIYSWDIEVVFN